MFRPFVRSFSGVAATGKQQKLSPLSKVVAVRARAYYTTRASASHCFSCLSSTGSSFSFKTNALVRSQAFVRFSLGHAHHRMPLAVHLGSLSHFSSGQQRPPPGGNKMARTIGILGTSAVVLFGKGKYLIGALKLTKLAPLASMLVSVGTYSMFFGLPYAVGMVSLILVHETGHALVMHRYGIPFSPMVMIPFVGATIVMNKQPHSAWEDAMVAFGGPVLGGLGAGAVAVGAQMTQSQLLFALADWGFMINLFNLLPVGMMDGGRIVSAMSPYAGVAGLGLGSLLAYEGAIGNPIFYLILLAGGWETFQRFYNPQHLPPGYYNITSGQRLAITGGYFGLIGALLAGMAYNHRSQKPPEVLIREQQMEKQWDMRY